MALVHGIWRRLPYLKIFLRIPTLLSAHPCWMHDGTLLCQIPLLQIKTLRKNARPALTLEQIMCLPLMIQYETLLQQETVLRSPAWPRNPLGSTIAVDVLFGPKQIDDMLSSPNLDLISQLRFCRLISARSLLDLRAYLQVLPHTVAVLTPSKTCNDALIGITISAQNGLQHLSCRCCCRSNNLAIILLFSLHLYGARIV